MYETTTTDLHAEMQATDLEYTFGPNWRSVIAAIRRAGTLTLDEAQLMAAARTTSATTAARYASLDTAWYAARDAAMYASLDTAWYAARDAAMYAASDASSMYAVMDASSMYAVIDAASDAAAAIVVADLVGQHGLTQAHIDTLMQPWTDTLGQDWYKDMMPS